ncbi:NADH:flavin oxidoreductase/NADH oxidase [Desulfonema limicola]|uniref:NADH:flavin oxidoreductase/NADH oxidase n=1 Tax=Desulfonema limicola TaxID=45656 RepID=A0A975B9Y5_9BACT|nr:FAD-dependent oxidoreductase [Desulfonema limicola]QTA81456.1 NADH:flavin oxidoreductase/NADH oxidase [Desulfonema limicola]
MYEHLFSPLKLGKTELANRICLLAHRTNFGRGGVLNDRHIAYYRRRAQGGCGLIIIGELAIHPDDRPWESLIDMQSPGIVGDLKRLTDAVHEFDTRVFAQLNHHGFQSSGHITRKSVWGPSATSDIVFGETCKPMEPEDFIELAEAFAGSALKVKESGFDGIEIDMGPESLLRQFLSPICNHRGDEYGGSLENRMRLPLQIVDAVRGAVGRDFTVGVCLCADEKFWGGITLEESIPIAQTLEKTGWIDFINVSVGTYYNLHMIMPSLHIPYGFTIETAEAVKKGVSLPVLASYQIGFPGMAENIIAEGKADAAGFVRALICDPDMAVKAEQGKIKDIRYCVKDNKGCIGRLNQSKVLGCIQNPQIGHEPLTGKDPLIPAVKKKKVMVIGAGPSGMEAARTACERGHDVTVYEKQAEVGGQVNLIGKRPGRESMPGVIRYLKNMLDKLEVPVLTNVTVTPELILEEKPDAVVVATGSIPIARPFPGNYDSPWVLTGWDAIRETHLVGQKVLFIDEDGGHHAMATAELLASQGRKVDIITSDLFIGIELAPRGELYLGRQRLLQQGATFTTDVEVLEINDKQVIARDIYTNEPVLYEGYDTIVLDVGNTADDALYKKIKGLVKEVYRTGDCVAPRGIDMAIIEARNVGELL